MAKTLTTGLKCVFTIGNFVTADGQPAQVDATTPITRLEVGNVNGTCQLQADVDADTSTGVRTFTLMSEVLDTPGGIGVLANVSADQLSGEIHYQATEAVGGTITLGEPESV